MPTRGATANNDQLINGVIAMTENAEQLMQELLYKDLYQWSADELDTFIVDAYLSLRASMRGELHTSDGKLVEPYMDNWGKYEGARCRACLAGAFFVSRTGALIQQGERPSPFYENEDYGEGVGISVLTLLDGLRYLEAEEDSSIHELLSSLGYQIPPVDEDAEGDEERSEQEVAGRLERFIDLNPRLRQRLRVATTIGEQLCGDTTDLKAEVDGVMEWHKREVQEATRRVMAAYNEAGARLRHLLLPMLYRWGMGMQRGGALMYHLPPDADMEVDLTADHPFAAVMDKYCDYHLWALAEPLADAMREEAYVIVGTPPDNYPDDSSDHYDYEGDYLSDYMEDIPLPPLKGREYLWVQIEGEEDSGLPYLFPYTPIDYVVPPEDGGGPFFLPGAVLHGPVTREYVDDIRGRDDYRDLVYVLPRYVMGSDGKFRRELV